MDTHAALHDNDIPEWHIQMACERLEEYKKHPKLALDFDEAMDEIEKELTISSESGLRNIS